MTHSPGARTLALCEPARDPEHQREREVGRGVGEDPGRVADRDSARRGRLHVDVVHTHGVVRDRAQVRRGVDQLGVDRIGEQREQAFEPRRAGEQLGASAAAAARAKPPRRAQPRGAEAPLRGAGGLRTREHGHPLRRGAWHERGRQGRRTEKLARATTAVALVANEQLGIERSRAVRRAPARRPARRSNASTSGSSSGRSCRAPTGSWWRVATAASRRAAAAAGSAGIPLAVAPAGTANDFADRLGAALRPLGGLRARGARHPPARARARLAQPRAPVRERGERRAARPGGAQGRVVEAAARARWHTALARSARASPRSR